jgi:hypothetical protein
MSPARKRHKGKSGKKVSDWTKPGAVMQVLPRIVTTLRILIHPFTTPEPWIQIQNLKY